MRSGARLRTTVSLTLIIAATLGVTGCTSNALQTIDIAGLSLDSRRSDGASAATSGFAPGSLALSAVVPPEPAVDAPSPGATGAGTATALGPAAGEDEPNAAPAAATAAIVDTAAPIPAGTGDMTEALAVVQHETDAGAGPPIESAPVAGTAEAGSGRAGGVRGLLASFWSNTPRAGVPAATGTKVSADPAKGDRVKPAGTLARTFRGTGEALPGVRPDRLFEISRKAGPDDDADIDLEEDDGSYRVASAGGLARLAPNGLLVQREGVDISCLKPSLVRTLKAVERHYGRPVVVTSGYRSPAHNYRVRGARHSQHMNCAAADIQVEGVGKWELARYLRAMPGRGGVGTYCHTDSVHVDVGPERDWNWRCRRRK